MRGISYLLPHFLHLLAFFLQYSLAHDPEKELAHELVSFFRAYKDGSIERLQGTQVIPPSFDPQTGVSSKDVLIAPKSGVSARIYLPKLADSKNKKLPVLVYVHGGGFIVESPFSPAYHPYLNSVASEATVLAVSVRYRLAPEYPLPTAHEDSWTALQWVAYHATKCGPEPWLTDHGDFDRFFIAGDSAGANIVHHTAMRAGLVGIGHGVRLSGAVLVQPFFIGVDPLGSELADPSTRTLAERVWMAAYPSMTSFDDPLINPLGPAAPRLSVLGCERMLVCVAEKEALRDRIWRYYEAVGFSGWGGIVEILESEGEDHGFHLSNPKGKNARILMKRLVSFINWDFAGTP